MLKVEKYEVLGWEHVVRGMRNPMNSWDKSDSKRGCMLSDANDDHGTKYVDEFFVGDDDLALMMKLRESGTDHRKFMRMITVYVDITAPLYWWKEFDTYKVGTVANSCSTMHKIHAKEFTLDDFSCEHLLRYSDMVALMYAPGEIACPMDILKATIDMLNRYRLKYLAEPECKTYWWQMIQLLPSSYNQKRTVMLNYEVLANIYKSRRNHKLDEWHTLCEWTDFLPYGELIRGLKEKER